MGIFNFGDPIVPRAPIVVSETLGGEAVIMHHGTGHYFNAIGTGALLWEAIEQGATEDDLVARLVAACQIDADMARSAVADFLQTLAQHDLVELGARTAILPPQPLPMPFAQPELHVHQDLADMLLLDPVHDVDEGGWPAPRLPDSPGAASWSA